VNLTLLKSRYSSLLWLCIFLTSVLSIISACTAHISGKQNSELRQPERLEASYTNPQYTIGIVQFDNKVPAIVAGAGESAAAILGAQLEKAGLNTILLDENAPKETDKPKAPQRTDVIKIVKKDTGKNFVALEYLLSCSVTFYSEAEEGIDANTPQDKSPVARVTVDYAFSDAATGKLLEAGSAAGEYRMAANAALEQGTRPSFDPALRDGALRDALAKTTEKVTRKLASMPFQGKLLGVDGPSLVLKAGRRSQLKVGTQLAVYRVSGVLVDPDNGQVLAYKESKIGVIQLGDHQNENLSSATVVSGIGFQAGDLVKPLP